MTLDDFDRPLNKRGKKDAPMVGQHLAEDGAIDFPDCFLSSPAKRALLTARVIADELGFRGRYILRDRRIYEASSERLFEVVREVDASCNHLMMFGHNPGFLILAEELCGFSEENFPTCAVLSVGLEIDNWSEIAPGCGKAQYYISPKQLKRP
jgi:phosphohistidine phosphatase